MYPTESKRYPRLLLRLAGTLLVAGAFLIVCRLMSDSVYGDTRLFAGPIWLFRTQSIEDKLLGGLGAGLLLPCIFAVGVWRSPATILLAILALVCWIGIGIWLEAIASV
jgi:hypothetical protein